MAKARGWSGLAAGLLLLLGGVEATAQVKAPPVAQVLSYRPRQQGVALSTPTPEEQKNCEVKLERGKNPKSSGWILLDAKKQTLRRFFDSDGDGKVDLWS